MAPGLSGSTGNAAGIAGISRVARSRAVVKAGEVCVVGSAAGKGEAVGGEERRAGTPGEGRQTSANATFGTLPTLSLLLGGWSGAAFASTI
jgi:hypothetical protein